MKGLKTVSEIAQQYELHPMQITQLKKEFLSHSADVFERDQKRDAEMERLKKKREELFRQIGELKFENDWYKKITLMPVEQKRNMIDESDAATPGRHY